MGFERRIVARLLCVLLVLSTVAAGTGGAAGDEGITVDTRNVIEDAPNRSTETTREADNRQENGTEGEPNDTRENATTLERERAVNGVVDAGDRDVFVLAVAAGESPSIHLDRRGGEGRFVLSIEDPTASPPTTSVVAPESEGTVDVPANSTGTRYVVVAPIDPGAKGSYTLSVSDRRRNAEARPDPDADVVGWEDGYWHDDPIAVDQRDGLTEAEIDAYLARAKARVEYVRKAEFRGNVSVEILSREEYVAEVRSENRTGRLSADADLRAWYNQRYEAAFIVGEDTDAIDAVEGDRETTVLGFFDPEEDRLVVISDRPETPVIDNATLIHELAHALQNQRFGLQRIREEVRTSDQDQAVRGLIEGEANYIEAIYEQRCADGSWECVETPPGVKPDRSDVNRGAFAITIQPYSDGPVLIDRLVREGGWAAVDAAYRRPPTSSEQIIHPDRYPGERPATITFGDLPKPLNVVQNPRNGWRLVTLDTLGEAWISSMFYYQGIAHNISIVSEAEYKSPDAGRFDRYDYDSAPSNGWGNDYLLPYRKGGERGYIWVTKWDTERDAREFEDAYRRVLRGHGAERIDDRTWLISEGPFDDAFVLVRRGRTVTVVNTPTVGDLGDLYPGIRRGAKAVDSDETTGVTETAATNGTVEPNGTTDANAVTEANAAALIPFPSAAIEPTEPEPILSNGPLARKNASILRAPRSGPGRSGPA